MHVDGNVLAGPLSEALGVEITLATTTCVGCGRSDAVASLHVYTGGPGVVARCPGCTSVVLRYVRTTTAGYLDLRGTIALRVALPVGP